MFFIKQSFPLALSLQLLVSIWPTGNTMANSWDMNRHLAASPAGEPLGFVAHPQSRLVESGSSTYLAVLPKGAVKTIQWRKNGAPLPGENRQFIEVTATVSPERVNPDQYDVVIQDAFGKQAVSRPATVTPFTKDAARLNTALQLEESLKLQNLLNVVDLFKQVAFRIEEAWDGAPLDPNVIQRYDVCPQDLVSEVMQPVETPEQVHKAVKLEFRNCFLSRTDSLGNEAGSLVSGTYIYSEKKQNLMDSDVLQTETFARNLLLRFPFAEPDPQSSTVDFDIRLNGKLIQTLQTTYLGEINQRSIEDYQWTSGTRIENPQTGIDATILSGKYSIERFGENRSGRYIPLRESRYFNNLKIKVGNDTVIIRGLVSRIGDQSDPQRSGKFEIWINGKSVIKAASAVSPLPRLDTPLPYSPKLNGFFNNDHKRANAKKEEKRETTLRPEGTMKLSGIR